jgi:hypothetical protein
MLNQMTKNSPHAKAIHHKQSSFMSAPSVVTTWQTIYLHRLKHPRTFQSDLRPRLHRSGPRGLISHPPHASPSSCDGGSAICGGDFTKWQSRIGKCSTSCVGPSEDNRPTIFDRAYTEVIHTIWQNNHLMLLNTKGIHQHSRTCTHNLFSLPDE